MLLTDPPCDKHKRLLTDYIKCLSKVIFSKYYFINDGRLTVIFHLIGVKEYYLE